MKHRFVDFFVSPATREWVQEGRRMPSYSLRDLLHGYFYARWPYLYIGVGTGEHTLARVIGPLADWLLRLWPWQSSESDATESMKVAFADAYHGKVVPLDAATQLVTVQEDVRLMDLEHIIPYTQARDIVLRNPDHIVALECPCRASRPNPCLPLDVCVIIGEPFASFVAEHHAHRSRWVTPDEAVEILRATDERGNVHHAFFKDALLDRFYTICNCCACCCGAMQGHREGTPMLASSGYVSQVDPTRCEGCGDCASFCQFQALAVRDGINTVDTAACMGCGVCVSKCERGTLSLVREPSRGTPLVLRELMESASGVG